MVIQTEYKYCYDVVLHYVLHYLNEEIKDDTLSPIMSKLPGLHISSAESMTS